jgi:UDP-2-acetamido-2-deoxy-ribo-hexuluronate aminotransferase
MRQVRVHGQAKKHHHPVLGINGRLDSIQAAVVLAKLPIFDDEIAKRQHVAEAYGASLSRSSAVAGGLQLPSVSEGNTSVWAQYTMLSPDRDALREKLTAAGIPSVSYYAVPLHLQPVFNYLGHNAGDFPIAERAANEGISLPMNPYLNDEEIHQVVSAFD